MNSDFNTFNSPTNTNTNESDLPITESGEKLDADEIVSEKVGPTSDENGYGTDERGYSKERNDLGVADYNKQVGQRVSEVYAAAEKDLEAEEKAAFPGWYDDAPSATQTGTDPTPPEGSPAQSKNSPILPENNPAPSETTLKAEAVRVLEDAIYAKKIADEKFYNAIAKLAANITASDQQSPDKPTSTSTLEETIPIDAPQQTTPQSTSPHSLSSESAAHSADTTAEATTKNAPTPLSSAAINTPPEDPISSAKVRTESTPPQTFLGKDGISYSSREDAINSFKD